MDFELSEEQTQLKDSVERLIARRYGFEQRAQYLREQDGWSREMWAQFAQLGLQALPFSEEDGGFGAGPVEMMIVMEAFGSGLVVEPYLATTVLGGSLMRLAASSEQRQRMLPGMIDGSQTLAFAHSEPEARYDLAHVNTSARQVDGRWRINGSKSLVLHGDSADKLIASARVSGERRSRDGLALFIVDATASGVSRRGYALQDGTRAAEVAFADVAVSPENVLGVPGEAMNVIDQVTDEAIAATCAELVGAMGKLQALTVEYLKTRQQFGKPIGTFQALQHRAVDMLIALEQARSMALYATSALAFPDRLERRRAISAAKVQVGRSARFIGQQAVQLHGAVGVTLEYMAGHYVKRMTMLEFLFGDANHHQSALARSGGLFAPTELSAA